MEKKTHLKSKLCIGDWTEQISHLMAARSAVSSTVISTCSSSLRCSQLALPRFCSSCNKQPQQRQNYEICESAIIILAASRFVLIKAKQCMILMHSRGTKLVRLII